MQHPDMKGLMDSDVRNLGRLAAFVRDTLPFDVVPVRAPAPNSHTRFPTFPDVCLLVSISQGST